MGHFTEAALLKVLLHATKYPCRSINGVLLVKAGDETQVVDVIPISHNCIALSPTMETALFQIDAYAQAHNLTIGGYYCGDHKLVNSEGLNAINKKVADKIADKSKGQALVLLLDSRKLQAFSAKRGPLPFELLIRDATRTWKRATSDITFLEDTNSEKLNKKYLRLVEDYGYRSLQDFDDHLDNLQNDYFNPGLLKA